eukprot:175905_1
MANESKDVDNTIKPLGETDEKKDNELQPKTIKLHTGYDFPVLGFGATWSRGVGAYWCGTQDSIWNKSGKYDTQNCINEQNELQQAIATAIKNGYKLIDTAQGYTTEHLIGNILSDKKYNIDRKDIFITSKLGSNERTIEKCKNAVENSLKLLQTNYIDLYLIHSPHTDDDGSDVIKMYKYLLDEYKSN